MPTAAKEDGVLIDNELAVGSNLKKEEDDADAEYR